jgi:hypothetical protein
VYSVEVCEAVVKQLIALGLLQQPYVGLCVQFLSTIFTHLSDYHILLVLLSRDENVFQWIINFTIFVL